MSEFTVKVLRAIEDANINGRFTSPSWIANAVFPPDHPGWLRSCKCGPYGSNRGSGLVMMMGGYIGKLHHHKPPLVRSVYRNGSKVNELTSDGRKMLLEAESGVKQ